MQVWFKRLGKIDAPHTPFTHCMLHRHALVSKMLPLLLADIFKIVVEKICFVKGWAVNHCIFMQLCQEMNSKFKSLLRHTEIQWLSQEVMMNHVFAMPAELMEFLESHNHQHSKHFEDLSFIFTLAYLVTSLVPSIS